MNPSEVFSAQADLMRRASDLLMVRRQKIPPEMGVSLPPHNLITRIFKERSLRLYEDTLKYLAGEIERSGAYPHYFLLPHVRTLLDIFSRFVHLQAKSEVQQGLICAAYQLKTHRLVPDAYATGLQMHQTLFTQNGIEFPQDPTLFDEREHVRKRGLSFGNMKDLLSADRVKDLAMNTRDVFVGGVLDEMYGPFSEYIHGNPFQYTGVEQNERFWVAATTVSTTAYLIEIVDTHTLNWRNPRDARDWLKDAKRTRDTLTGLWLSEIRRRQSELS